jgi:hypothetical protein
MAAEAAASFPQAGMLVASANPVTHGSDMTSESILESSRTDNLSDLFVDPSTGFAPENLSSQPLNLNSAGRTASASAQKTVGEKELPAAAKDEVPPVGSHAEGGNTPAAGEIPTQAAAPSLATVQASSQEQPLPHNANLAKPISAGQILPQTQVPDQSEIQTQIGAKALPVAQDSRDLNSPPIAANIGLSDQLLAAAGIQSKSGSTDGKRLSASEPLQSARGTGKSDSYQRRNHVMQRQPFGAAEDASVLTRAVAGAAGASSTSDGPGPHATAATSEPDSREAFATLDAGGATGKPTWIHAGAQRAEAGFKDPALGWVGIRADASGSGVHAELVASSADAAQTLGGHLAGLNAYLADHHTPVETLTLASSESGWSASGNDMGSGEGTQQGAGHQTGQETTQNADSETQFASSTTSELPAWSVGRDRNTQAARLDGNHISVMA